MLIYGVSVKVTIEGYHFKVVWPDLSVQEMRDMTKKYYFDSLQRAETVRSRDLPTERGDRSELRTWRVTRIHSPERPLVREVEGQREPIGGGSFGNVYKAIDASTGNYFAIKVVKLDSYPRIEEARAAVHREITNLKRVKHVRITISLITCSGQKAVHWRH